MPPSVHADGSDRWVQGFEFTEAAVLPRFNPAWRPVSTSTYHSSRHILDGAAYISTIRAEEGKGGDAATFKAALALKDAGLDETTALAVLSDWNRTNAKPPWSHGELLHKVKCAYRPSASRERSGGCARCGGNELLAGASGRVWCLKCERQVTKELT